jgi:hypothetical protein
MIEKVIEFWNKEITEFKIGELSITIYGYDLVYLTIIGLIFLI